jgi:hypothetical protein
MYMRVRRISHDVTLFDESLPLALEAHAAMKQLPGWQSGLQAIDRTTGEGFSVTMWDTEDHARFSSVVTTERAQAVGAQMDPPRIYEVIAD